MQKEQVGGRVMQTRIRQMRKTRGLTLQQLAERINTTAQTIQRLETGNMTVSIDWLEKLSHALDMHPSDLLEGGAQGDIPLLGKLEGNGVLYKPASALNEETSFRISIPAIDPVAISLGRTIGAYNKDSILIAERFYGRSMSNVYGCDGLAHLATGTTLLRRIIRGSGERFTLVPIRCEAETLYDQELEWAARIIMQIEYF